MFSDVISNGFEIFRDRWKALLGAALAMVAMVTVVMVPLFLVGAGSLLDDKPAASSAAPASISAPQSNLTGQPSGGIATAPQSTPAGGSTSASMPDVSAGVIAAVVVAALVMMVLVSAAQLGGIAIALGSDIRSGFMAGFRGLPYLVSQLVIALWPQLALCIGGMAIGSVIPALGIPFLVAGYVWLFLRSGVAYAVMASVAAGDRSWRPDRAMDLLGSSSGLTGALAIIVIGFAMNIGGIIPIVGIVMSLVSMMWAWAGTAAFYQLLGGDPLNSDGSARTLRRGAPDTSSPDPAVAASASHAGAAAVASAAVMPSGPVSPIAIPQATAQPVAGPTFDGDLAPQTSWGEWLTLASAGRVAVQITWSGDVAPAVHAQDASGGLRAASARPAAQGQPTWLELPAGQTYVSVQAVAPAAQRLSVRTWVPAPATGAAPIPRAA